MIAVVDLCLDPISLLDASGNLGGMVRMQTPLLFILPLNEICLAVNAQHLAINRLMVL